jgi:hypothetical protein
MYEAGDQRSARTESEQLQHGRYYAGRFVRHFKNISHANKLIDIEAMKDSGHTTNKAAEHEHKVNIHAPEENTPQTN